MSDLIGLPERASKAAAQVDYLFLFLIGVSLFFAILIFVLIAYFAFKYRRRTPDQVGAPGKEPVALELTWMLIPFLITIVMFAWGAKVYSDRFYPPETAEKIFVVGKQWMWKIQHQSGAREINELHVPAGRPIRLIMTSEDVIHSFFVPAFRSKMDVIPGRYTTYWFEADKLGSFPFYCAEYCGTDHSRMKGRLIVMKPAAFAGWLGAARPGESMASQGEKLFTQLACGACHQEAATAQGPPLAGVFGKPRPISGEKTIMADESYLRTSILTPGAQVLAGYQPTMPTYQGQLNEEELLQLIAYLRSLGTGERKQ